MNGGVNSLLLELESITTDMVLDNLPDGAYITDLDRRIVYWNDTAERITGWTRDDVIGKRCRDNVLCHVDKDDHLLCGYEHCPLHRAMITGEASGVPRLIYAKCADQRRIPVEVSVAPLRNDEGVVIGGIEIFRDLSTTFDDLVGARAIQRAAVGVKMPADDRFELAIRYAPHDEIGGDFYRIDHVHGNTYALFLADIVGHGISAALYAMELRSLWDEHREYADDPAQALACLNNRIAQLMGRTIGYFATALHVTYDAETGALAYTAAGHPAPVCQRADGRTEVLDVAGSGLGLLPDADYRVGRSRLDPGDTLLLFTDGALEIDDRDGVPLSQALFHEMIRKADVQHGDEGLANLEVDLLRYSNDLSLPDDLTLMSLRRVV